MHPTYSSPSQLDVAVSRGVCKKGLKILNFTPYSIMKHPDSLVCFYANEGINYVESLRCCRRREFGNEEMCDNVIHDDDDESLTFRTPK